MFTIVKYLTNKLSSAHFWASRFPQEEAREEIFWASERPMLSDSLSTLLFIEYASFSIIAVIIFASFELLTCSTHWIVRLKIALSDWFKTLNQRCLRMALWRLRTSSILENIAVHHHAN